jgi:hypothetical protein
MAHIANSGVRWKGEQPAWHPSAICKRKRNRDGLAGSSTFFWAGLAWDGILVLGGPTTMQYFAERSGIVEDLRASGLERAKDAIKRHVLEAYQGGRRARGEAYALLDDSLRVPLFLSWNGPGITLQEVLHLTATQEDE